MNDNLAARSIDFISIEYLNCQSKIYYSIPTIPYYYYSQESCTLDLCRGYELIKRII